MLFPASYVSALDLEKVSQIVMPKDIYVGDPAEIHFSFESPESLLQEGVSLVTLHNDAHFFAGLVDDCSIKTMTLQRTNRYYVLVIQFVPWRTGNITIPAFDLCDMIPAESRAYDASVFVKLEPVTIASLAEKGGYTTLRPVFPPLLLPGTSYIVYVCVIVLIILCIIVVRILLHFHHIMAKMRSLITLMKYRHNAAGAVRELRKTSRLGTSVSESVVCERIEKTLRGYLSYRFAYPFESVTADRLSGCFTEDIMAGMISEEQLAGIEHLCALFARCDYIRFAQNSVQQPELQEHERSLLLTEAIGCIRFFEGGSNA